VARRQDGIPLAVAVSCSTAAPGAAPPVTVANAIWVDGAVRSSTNADLLVDAEEADGRDQTPGKILVVAPRPADAIAREEAILAARGHEVRVVIADPFIEKPTDLINPRFIDAAVDAGTRQARHIADELITWWSK
jgi:NTE family protein